MSKNRAPKASYDFEVAILGMIPASEKERSDGQTKENVRRYQTALREIAKHEVARTGLAMFGKKDRVVVTIIQFMALSKDFENGHDVDNFAKTVLDPLEGVVYECDAQVQVLLASKVQIDGYSNIAYVGVHRVPTSKTYDDLLKCANVEHALKLCDAAPRDTEEILRAVEEGLDE
ncbi:RusA family crossover junction endodeoxyribonuclease [Patescibacteria group bacterium]|nr:RusA family crossover junction endodeoxyribonuclease [Patescibacteria group bacterium]